MVSRREGSNPSGGTSFDLSVCSCDKPQWIDDAGDSWQYCANCKELARPIDEIVTSLANKIRPTDRSGPQVINLETFAWDENGEVDMLSVSEQPKGTPETQSLEDEDVLSASSSSSPSNSFAHLPTEIGAKELTPFINAFRALDENLRKGFDTCVMWVGAGAAKGHCGVVRRYGLHKKVISQTPFRYVWEQVHQTPVQENMEIGHTCKSPKNLCINPNHLFSGTREAVCVLHAAQGRLVKEKKMICKRGHRIEGDNEFICAYKDGRTRRSCKLCRMIMTRLAFRRRTGAKPRSERTYPDMSNSSERCKKGLHRFTYANTAVYFNKTYGKWHRQCRECAKKRCRILQRRYYGFKPLPRYRDETFLR